MDTAWMTLRLFNVLLYGGILSGLIMHWRVLHVPAWPGFRWGLWMFMAASTYATAESVWRAIPGGPRLVAISASLIILFIGCYWHPIRRLLRKINFTAKRSSKRPKTA